MQWTQNLLTVGQQKWKNINKCCLQTNNKLCIAFLRRVIFESFLENRIIYFSQHFYSILYANIQTFFKLALVSFGTSLYYSARRALIMFSLHKYRTLGQDHDFIPLEGHRLALTLLIEVTEDVSTSRQFCWCYSFPAAILPPLHWANDAERWLILRLGANRLGKSKPDFCASRSTKREYIK